MDRRKTFVTVTAGILAGILLLSLLLGLFAGSVNAATSSEIMDQINDLKGEQSNLQDQITELENSLAQNNNEMMAMIERKDGIDSQIALLRMQIRNVTQQVSAYNLMIADKQEELDNAQAMLDQLSDEYKLRIRAMEEQGNLSYWSVIFKANSFSDLLGRLNMVLEIANADRNRLEQLKSAAEKVNQAKELLAQDKAGLERSKLALETAEVTLESKRTEANQLLAGLVAMGDKYSNLMQEAEEAERELMNEIAQKQNDYNEQAYKEWLATSVPPTTTSPAGSGTVTGGVTWYRPTVNYWASSEFGPRTHPVTGEVDSYHEGIDLAAPEWTPIYATRTGVVTVAATHWSAGNYVNINHGDGFSSIYMHMTEFVVSRGDYVTAGQLIGYVGSTGRSTGPHLHFGIAKNGVYQNPRLYVKL